MNEQPNEQKLDVLYIKKLFHETVDLFVQEIDWPTGKGIVCYYESIADGTEVNKQIDIIRNRAHLGMTNWGKTAVSEIHAYSMEELFQIVCSGSTAVIFPESKLMVSINAAKVATRSPEEPSNEQIVRGSHQGFVENIQQNLSLIRNKLRSSDLVIKTIRKGHKTNTDITYLYFHSIVDHDVVADLESRLNRIDEDVILSIGQVEDYLEDSTWSPFPQFMNTERPDRVVENLAEGKIAVFTDNSPTALIAPITFFSFYQSPDDFNGRVLVGSFYRLLRLFSLFMAIFLPAFYIAVVSFHSEILPIELSKKVKLAINEIPYRPIMEAFLLESFIELIREASIRLPKPIGQTIGIVGGLVVGDAIVNVGIVSNLMVIVVAMTAISSFVVPSVEMNMTIRLLRFPFMLAAASFGFFGMAIGTLILFIHLLNRSSLNQPYFSPVVPFDPTRFKEIFFRLPFSKSHKQQQTFYFKQPKRGRTRK
ncbi:spore germination protein ka [Bacillus sp. OxB-1]|uniref:spore germination protein n=1 Tax=Bacillus sp. (strain OxB-1) TaxID=98228 RepID=UPI000581DCF8|nr:spore germination protein [Bacillus sp. OxB-1]BAQ11006.1 spore germination protein ka [Bacillus sp. OxB-1]